jgi:hypothetical protein
VKLERCRDDRITEEEISLIIAIEEQGCRFTAMMAALEFCLLLMVAANGNIAAMVINAICFGILTTVAILRGILVKKLKRLFKELLEVENGTDS